VANELLVWHKVRNLPSAILAEQILRLEIQRRGNDSLPQNEHNFNWN
jgi:hypothetical protein